MKNLFIFAVLIISIMAMGADAVARVNNENNVQYAGPGWLYEAKLGNLGIGAYRETAVGADTVLVAFDISSATYTNADLWIEFTADVSLGATDGLVARNVAIYWMKSMAYSARTVTAGNKLTLDNMNSGEDAVEYAYRTATPDSTSYANKILIDNISGTHGESTGLLGPFWIDGVAAADSNMAGFLMITADTVGVSWKAYIVPRAI